MAVTLTTESPVACSCGKPAIRRTLPVSYGGKGGRVVSYDSHSTCLTEDDHVAALKRMDRFHDRLHELLTQCRAFTQEERKLTSGMILDFDFDTIHPDACNVRTDFVPTAMIQAYGLREEIRLSARPLRKQSAKRILAELKKSAIPIIAKLKFRFENGDF